MASPDDSLLSTSLPPLTSSPFDHQTPPTRASWNSFNDPSNGRSSSSPAIDSFIETPPHHRGPTYHHSYSHSSSMSSMTPQLIAIQEIETPTSSPSLRSASGRFKGGMRKLLHKRPSHTGTEIPSIGIIDTTPPGGGIEAPDTRHYRMFNKVMKQIKINPRTNFSGLRRPPMRRKARTARSNNRRHHYSDDGYTSDPGLLRDVSSLHNSHEEDPEEEEDTESGDREGEARAVRIARLQDKLEKHKRSLQEEEATLQEAQNVYVLGMEGSMNDKDHHRLKKNFISKQAKSKEEIDQLKRKVERYEEQLQELKEGRVTHNHPFRRINRMRYLGSGVRQGIKILRRKKPSSNSLAANGIEDEDEEEMVLNDDIETESHVTFADDDINMKEEEEEEVPCEYCLNEYRNIMGILDDHKSIISQLQQSHSTLKDKLQQERDKTERLENELNTLTDLHQNGVIELRGQLAQMERISFSKSQDLEDNVENCQTRLHALEVKITHSDDIMQRPVATGVVRKVGVPFLSYALDVMAVCFKLSTHVGLKAMIAFMILLIAIVFYYMF